jgi:CheY-like chemotaxis protein
MEAAFKRGLEAIRDGRYFEAHEELEEAWKAAPAEERDFFQGLVHVAVAWYQAGRGRRVGCERQLEKAARRLAPYAPVHGDVDVAFLVEQVRAAQRLGTLVLPPVVVRDPRTILLVDDEAPIRLLCRVNLEAEGLQVAEAVDGAACVEAARRTHPDLILLGVTMPRVDGWQAAEQLRRSPTTRDIPVVFLTARAKHRDRLKGLELGAVDYITKPFNPLELAPLVRELLALGPEGRRERRRRKLEEVRLLVERDPDGPSDV